MLWTEKRRARRRKRKQAKLESELQTQYAGAQGGPMAEHMADGTAESKTDDAMRGIVPVLVLPASAAAAGSAAATGPSAAPAPGAPLRDVLDESDSDDSDGSADDAESDNEDDALMLAGGSADDEPVDPGTLARLNASLQKTLHDLLFTPATARQRARIEHEEEEETSFDGHAGTGRTGSTRRLHDSPRRYGTAPAGLVLSPMVRGMSGGSGRKLSDGNAHMHGQHVGTHRHGSLNESDSLDAQVPLDQMSRITKALADSGVSDMGAFLRVLAAKPQARSKTVFETCTDAELPPWCLAYPNITSGYRVNFSAQLCAKSLFKWS